MIFSQLTCSSGVCRLRYGNMPPCFSIDSSSWDKWPFPETPPSKRIVARVYLHSNVGI